jgi:hypothetical protein
MASFVVETFVPGSARDRFAAEAVGLRLAAEADRADPAGVRLVRSYLVPGDEMGFHVVDAASAEIVARVAVAAGIEVERIVESVGVAFGSVVGDGG